jgi:hypothetical protein
VTFIDAGVRVGPPGRSAAAPPGGHPAANDWRSRCLRVRRDDARRGGELVLGYQVTRESQWRVAPSDRSRNVHEVMWLLSAGAFVCLMVVLVGLFGMTGGESSAPARTAVVRVQQGDTLWSLAHRFAPNDDPRAVVRRIVDLNALDGSVAQVGQSLVVPVGHG